MRVEETVSERYDVNILSAFRTAIDEGARSVSIDQIGDLWASGFNSHYVYRYLSAVVDAQPEERLEAGVPQRILAGLRQLGVALQPEYLGRWEFTVATVNDRTVGDGRKPDNGASQQTATLVPAAGAKARLAAQNLNLLLEGVPGTGKTYAFKDICEKDKGLDIADNHRFVLNCHPSTQYEDVIEGLRPEAVKNENPWQPVHGSTWTDNKAGAWHVVDGVFLRACTAARLAPLVAGKKARVAILLDELNRANVPRMLGDLLTVMERSKRATFDGDGNEVQRQCDPVILPISGRTFLVPDNLIIVATMNSVDHSVAPLDQALLRRFWRVRVEPMNDKHAIAAALERKDDSDKRSDKDMWAALSDPMKEAVDAFVALNETIGAKDCLGPDGMIGQSFLFDMKALCAGQDDQTQANAIRNVWRYGVAPQVIASVQAAGKERWFSGSENDDSNGVTLVNALANCYFTLTWKGAGMTRALRMVPLERPAQTDDKVQ